MKEGDVLNIGMWVMVCVTLIVMAVIAFKIASLPDTGTTKGAMDTVLRTRTEGINRHIMRHR